MDNLKEGHLKRGATSPHQHSVVTRLELLPVFMASSAFQYQNERLFNSLLPFADTYLPYSKFVPRLKDNDEVKDFERKRSS